jgi:hypothetical protein
MEWQLHITYGLKSYTLQTVLEYHSNQIMRIRVNGSKRSLLLENNYPLLRLQKSKKGIQWKIREGSLDAGSEKNSRLLMEIMEQLEYIIKKEFPIVAW